MTTLKEQIETRNVRFRLDKSAVICLRTENKKPIRGEDGTPQLHTEPAVYITRVGDGKMGPFSQQLDTSESGVADYVAFVDEWIDVDPARARRAGLSKLGSVRPPSKIQNWDNMSAEQIRSVLEATQIDLTWAYEFELLRPEVVLDLAGNQVEAGTREDVMELLEEIYANGFQSVAEQSEDAPVL